MRYLTTLVMFLIALVVGSRGKEDFTDKLEEDAGIDILKNEGRPGWIEGLLEKEKKFGRKRTIVQKIEDLRKTNENERERRSGNKIPSLAVTKLSDAFNKIGPQSDGAKAGLTQITNKWGSLSFGDRAVMTQTLQSAASNIEKFANAKENPIEAVQGALNMVSQFAALAGPKGQIIAVAISFISGFLSLFGAGSENRKSVGEIVREEIKKALDEYYDKVLTNEATSVADVFEKSKAYVDHLAQLNQKLTVDQAKVLKIDVPLWQGLTFMGKLAGEIDRLLTGNKRGDSRKALRYIEMYTKLAILKDMIIQEAATLLPDELAPNRGAMFAVQKRLRDSQHNMFKFLFKATPNGKVAAFYYDPDYYPVADAYLIEMLKVPNYDRSLAGTWCITPAIRGKPYVPLSWHREHSSLMQDGHPYITLDNEGCFWKLIPHGNNFFTVQNTFHCPNYDYCNQYMSFDVVGGDRTRATVEPDPILWEIYGHNQKRIRNTWGCYNQKWCHMHLGPQKENVAWSGAVSTFGLKSNVGYIWWLTKALNGP